MKRIVAVGVLALTLSAYAAPVEMPKNAAMLRVRLGLGDKETTDWSGEVKVSPGRVASIQGWRFAGDDKVTGNAWTVHTRQLPVTSSGERRKVQAGIPMPMGDNGLILTLADVASDTNVEFTTQQGNFAVALKELPLGQRRRFLDNRAEVERCAVSTQVSAAIEDEDYPAAAVAADGAVYLAYMAFARGKDFVGPREAMSEDVKDFSYLAQPTGGDRVWLRILRDGTWSEPVAITDGGEDLYKPAVAVDGTGRAWVFFSKNVGASKELTDGNWELMARAFKDDKLGPVINVSNAPGPDFAPVAATDSRGRVWVAWQGARETNFDIFAAVQEGDSFGKPQRVSDSDANDWDPAIAVNKQGDVAVAWDTYAKGDYDICLRIARDGKFGPSMPVAGGTEHDIRPALTYDGQGRLWVAWEQAGERWGKDNGPTDRGGGLAIYAPRQIIFRIWDGAKWSRPAGEMPLEGKVGKGKGKGEADPTALQDGFDAGRGMNPSLARLATDGQGHVWLAFRGRFGQMRPPVGTVFFEFVSRCTGSRWQVASWVPNSDNTLDNRPALAPLKDGGLLLLGSCDERQKQAAGRGGRGKGKKAADEPAQEGPRVDPFNNNLYVAQFDPSAFPPAAAADLKLEEIPAPTAAAPLPEVAEELKAVKTIRDYRVQLGSETLRLMRGEFHRHTEISGDGGGDGPLLDMWRYGLDAAYMDWIGNGDHDNGNGREYSWWITQKTTDLFRIGNAFVPMFSYERSVSYPEGHRNPVFARRGVRTLPRLPLSDPNVEKPAPDTQMLYRYLRQLDGITAEHTSTTNMGTDWRDNDPKVEPIVEIFQGCRQNYEMPGAPRSPNEETALNKDFKPKGFVSLALLKGYRLGFQSSSDHGSTHISYCNVWVAEPTRQAILDGMKKRRIYGSTDNIVADVRCVVGNRTRFMGEEFSTPTPPKLNVKLIGTRPFAKVCIVRQNEYVHTIEPKTQMVEFTWTDAQPERGKTLYYYIRGEQEDGELVWVSPMWIRFEG